MARTPLNPLNYQTRITKPDGTPTDEFIRQWNQQLLTNTTTDEQLAEAVAAAVAAALAAAAAETAATAATALVTTLAATQVGGDGIDIDPPPAALSAGNITLELTTTGVTPDTYGDAGNVPQFTVDANGRITGVMDVPISGGGGAPDVEDDGVLIVAAASVLNFTGAGVTATDAGAGQVDIDIPGGGGGGGWTLHATQALTSGASFDFTGLGGSTDILMLVVQASRTASSFLRVLASVDNGATFFSGSSNYRNIGTNGSDATATGFNMSGAVSAAVRSGYVNIFGANVSGANKLAVTNDSPHYLTGSTDAIDALRLETSAGTFTAGTAYVFKR